MLRPALVALCAATIATEAMAQSTGIAVCDELFGKWEACLTKMPDFDRKIQKSILDELRRSVGEKLKKDLSEPPRVCRRLQILRDWSYGESQDVSEVLGRGA